MLFSLLIFSSSAQALIHTPAGVCTVLGKITLINNQYFSNRYSVSINYHTNSETSYMLPIGVDTSFLKEQIGSNAMVSFENSLATADPYVEVANFKLIKYLEPTEAVNSYSTDTLRAVCKSNEERTPGSVKKAALIKVKAVKK